MTSEEDSKSSITVVDSSSFSENVAPFFLNDCFSDIKLRLDDGIIINAHKIILAARCKFFHTKLLKDPTQYELDLSNVSAKAFEKILQFVYTGSIVLPPDGDLISDVLKLAHDYTLATLEKSVSEQLPSVLNTSNVGIILNKANSYDLPELRELCHKFIDQNVLDVLATDFFHTLTQKSMVALLERDSFPLTEIDVFKIVQNWCKTNTDVDNLVIKTIRLSCLTRTEILKYVWPSGLIDDAKLLRALSELEDIDSTTLQHLTRTKTTTSSNNSRNPTKVLSLHTEKTLQLLELENVSCIQHLTLEQIRDKVKPKLNLDNVSLILNTANLYSVNRLREVCHTFMDQNVSSIIEKDCLSTLTKKSLIQLLRRDAFSAPEIEIFKSVAKWCENNIGDEGVVSQCVRLSLLSVTELLSVVWPSNLVDCRKLLEVIAEIVELRPKTSRARSMLGGEQEDVEDRAMKEEERKDEEVAEDGGEERQGEKEEEKDKICTTKKNKMKKRRSRLFSND